MKKQLKYSLILVSIVGLIIFAFVIFHNTESTFGKAIEKNRGPIDSLIAVEEVHNGVVAFFTKQIKGDEDVIPSLEISYVKETMFGRWTWIDGFGGTIINDPKSDSESTGVLSPVHYISNEYIVTKEQDYFYIAYGIIENEEIEAIGIEHNFKEKPVALFKIDGINSLYYATIDNRQDEHYFIYYDTDNVVVDKKRIRFR
ncbi:hypothetical protein [Alkalihalobacterium bogoriense]|uniref:hypothetical protein n=1 Tax=Alkalihalobacterium bogoriense TaxID=246272 RepID=UPI000479B8AB|nr:hypothetical protein [Alkalihalobacterium bogoriense]